MSISSSRRIDVVVVRALRGLGDLLCAVPALRLIRRSLPNAWIRYVGIDEVEPLVARYGRYINEFDAFGSFPGIEERSESFDPARLESCRGAELVVQMHGSGTASNRFCVSLEPKALSAIGTVVAPAECKVSTHRFDPTQSEVQRCLDVAERGVQLLGFEPEQRDTRLEFPLRIVDLAEAASCRDKYGFARQPYAILHAGAATEERRWPAARFARVGRRLLETGVRPVLTGTGAERFLARKVAELIGPEAVVVAGTLSIGGTAALVSSAAGVVTNDTGMSHLAAAVRTPSVVVFTSTDPRRWAPPNAELHRSVSVPSPAQVALEAPSAPIRIGAAANRQPDYPSVEDTLAAAAALGFAR